MRYYPINLDIRDKPCVVIGGGKVAERKTFSLVKAGARVKIISPDATDKLKCLEAEGKVIIARRLYKNRELKGAFLVFAATDNEDVNRKISEQARNRGILVNVVDRPEICDFIVPSVVERGLLSIAISTGGASPAFAKRLREEMEECYGEEHVQFLEIMAAIRQKLLTIKADNVKKRKFFNKLAYSSMPELIKAGMWEDVDRIIISLLGEDFSIASLKIKKA